MSCNCIDVVEANLSEKFENDPKSKITNLRINKTFSIDLKDDKKPILTYLYNKLLKDGSSSSKIYEGNIIPSFCPFCGGKYVE